ncbi:MAG: metallopeptidase TldD-related protein, partial [Christensenellaceae bacterium]
YDEAKAWKKAEENLKNEIPYSAAASRGKEEHIDVSDGLLGDKAFVDKAKELLARLKETCPAFLFSNNILKTEHEISLVNDVGLDLSYRAGVYQLDLVMKEKASANIMDLGYSYTGKTFDVEKMASDIEDLRYYVPADIEEGEQYVLASLYDLGLDKLYEGIRADSYANGTGLFAGKLGRKVFNEGVTIYEDRTPDSGFFSCFFDDEGVVNEDYKNIVFENGVFKNVLACKLDARNMVCLCRAACRVDGVPQTGLAPVSRGLGNDYRERPKAEKRCI